VPLSPQCSTADCTWPPYGSLGLCVDLTNVTDATNRSTLGFYTNQIIQTSDFLFGNLTNAYPALLLISPFPSGFLNASAARTAVLESFIAFSPRPVANVTDGNVEGYNYFLMAFYFCTKTFETNVDRGGASVVEVARAVEVVNPPTNSTNSTNSAWNTNAFNTKNPNFPCEESFLGETMKLRGAAGLRNETYKVDMCTGLVFSQLFSFIINSATVWSSEFTPISQFGALSNSLGLSLFGPYPAEKVFDPATQFNNIKRLMENIADGATNL